MRPFYETSPDPLSAVPDDERGGAPFFTPLSDVTGDNTPPLSPPIIEGVLRRGHKMTITGPPKAGKSWCAIQLAYALANGGDWLGFRCRESTVAFVNGELEAPSFANRCDKVAAALWPDDTPGQRRARGRNVVVCNLRGTDKTLPGLISEVRAQWGGGAPDAIIIDPIYKLEEGDENSNSDMRDFVANLDRLAAMGCSVIHTHHHAKGAAGARSVTDRGAGAGVFGRDPDAIVDLNPLDVPEGSAEAALLEAEFGECAADVVPLRANFSLREFPDRMHADLVFDFPVMRPMGGLGGLSERGSADAARRRGSAASAAASADRAEEQAMLVQEAVEACEAKRVTPTREAVFEEYRRIVAESGSTTRPFPSVAALKKATSNGGGRTTIPFRMEAGRLVRVVE